MKTATALCLTGLLGCAQAFVAPQFSAPAAPRTRVSAARSVVKMENFNLPLGEVSVCDVVLSAGVGGLGRWIDLWMCG